MTLAERRAVDLERGTDQLVDEICVRLSALGAVLDALWSHQVSADPPPSWWSTPLGALVAAALSDHPQPAVPGAQHNGDAR
jgi:hypothetical protein